jgi:pyruvate dehydrogenase E2 component (dihydrolipoamide acetyltransferase)
VNLADLKGGTFSITNVGMIGGEAATPIINYPEVAILATLKIAERPRVEAGRIVARKTLPLCLSFDHRVVDGAEAARFMNDLKKILEQEELLRAAVKAEE